MATRKIIAATDGSEPATQAVKYAASLAKKLDAELVILHVISYKKVGYWAFIDTHFKKEMILAAEKILKQAEAACSQSGLTCRRETREAEETPYLSIVKFLEEQKDIAMLVLGDKGRDFVDNRVMGSTTDRVLHEVTKRQLKVPVLVVPYVQGEVLSI